MSKSVDEKTFKKCCNEMLAGRMHPDVAAYLCKLSRPTFYKRVNQYYCPEIYGALPENFFDGEKGSWKENTGWITQSVAIKRYKEREEIKKQRERNKQLHLQYLKERDTFKDASHLPDLGE